MDCCLLASVGIYATKITHSAINGFSLGFASFTNLWNLSNNSTAFRPCWMEWLNELYLTLGMGRQLQTIIMCMYIKLTTDGSLCNRFINIASSTDVLYSLWIWQWVYESVVEFPVFACQYCALFASRHFIIATRSSADGQSNTNKSTLAMEKRYL